MTTPTWHAPVAGSPFSAGDICQSLVSHPTTFIYQGTAKVTGAGSNSGSLNTNTGAASQWLSQPFITAAAQTTLGRVELNFTINGTGADLTIDLRTDNGSGSPSSTVLTTLTFPLDFEPGSVGTISVPLNATGLSATTKYHVVIHGTASTANYCKFQQGTTSGAQAMTSANGTSWSNAGVTMLFTVYDGSATGVLRHTWEDGGARFTGLDYAMGSASTSGPPTTVREAVGALRSLRTVSYAASGQPTTIT